ncbi:MAG: hypothetical protein AAGG51_22275 [Cyanobacteria bacterium P01_G01_bin.54]
MKTFSSFLAIASFALVFGVGGLTPAQTPAPTCERAEVPAPSPQTRTYTTDLGIQFELPANYRVRATWREDPSSYEEELRLQVVDPAMFAYQQCLADQGELGDLWELESRVLFTVTITDLYPAEPELGLQDFAVKRYRWMLMHSTIAWMETLNGESVLRVTYPESWDYQRHKGLLWRSPAGDRLVMLTGAIDNAVHEAAVEQAIHSFTIVPTPESNQSFLKDRSGVTSQPS